MKLKNRFLALFLVFTIMFSNISNVFAGNSIELNTSNKKFSLLKEAVKGNLKATIVFDIPELVSTVESKNVTLELLKDNTKVGEAIISDSSVSEIGDYTIKIVFKNRDGVELTTESEIGSIDVLIENVPLGNYKIKLKGKGYKEYTSDNLSIQDYSKQIIIRTNDRTFTIGDVNSDGEVNKQDLTEVENNLGTQNESCDLNGDGIVDIVDLSIVNHHILTYGSAQVFDYELIPGSIINNTNLEKEITAQNMTISSGTVEDIFKAGTEVKISSKTNTPVTEETPIVIPIQFEKPVEMEQIEIRAGNDTGSPEKGQVLVVYDDENGEEKEEYISFESSFYRALNENEVIDFLTKNGSENTIKIDLGKKVAIKKITIKVEKVQDTNGNVSYAAIEEIKFLKDVVPDVPLDSTVIKNVEIVPGSKELNLYWPVVPNVSGYKVYYGEKSKDYKSQLTVSTNSAVITGLKNLEKCYISVAPINNNWEGEKSAEFVGIPIPDKKPLKPDFVKVESGDASLKISWKKTDDAEKYTVYYKKEGAATFTKGTTTTSLGTTIYGLENNSKYILYVTASNSIGEGSPSLEVEGTPFKEEIESPKIPTKNKISNDNIESISLAHPDYYDKNLYPNGMDTRWLADGDFSTSWVARRYWEDASLTFLFKEAKDMNHLIYSPRLEGLYKDSMNVYAIEVWLEGDDLTKKGKVVASNVPINRGFMKENGYAPFTFPKQEKVKKLKVKTAIFTGARVPSSASEVIFYDYYDLDDNVKALFKDETFTTLADGVTEGQIQTLLNEVNSEESFYVNKETLLDELNLAMDLLKNKEGALGIIKNGIYSINPAKDNENYRKAINSYIPLGIVAGAGTTVNIYADIPEGETVNLVATQFYSEASDLAAPAIKLVNGRNEITIPKIGNLKDPRGGALYLQYTGDKGDQIKLHIRRDAIEIPTLELYNWASLTEDERKAKIEKYIVELTKYVPTLKGNKAINYTNSTEVSLPNVLLSLPADKILAGINSGNTTTMEQKVQKVYDNALAWEDFFIAVYTTYGLDSPLTALQTRQNIRYMRMFGNAFMYASGIHIGIGYGSATALIQGRPVKYLQSGDTKNGIFGWGIAHEVGHVLDKLGKGEITNNIFSLMAQTYDGHNNVLPSRIKDKYESIFNISAAGRAGEDNELFNVLVFFWQLHLAYDNGIDDTENGPFNFYNKVYKLLLQNVGESEDIDNRFALVASKAANKNLLDYFDRWGYKLTDAVKTEIKKLPEETRKIHYLNENSREKRIANHTVPSGNTVTASIAIDEENSRQVIITASSSIDSENIQGYEIVRNGKAIGFTVDGTYTDLLPANNIAITYTVNAIDILGNSAGSKTLDEFRLEFDNVIDQDLYTVAHDADSSIATATLNSTQIVTGIKLTSEDTLETVLPTTSNIKIEVKNAQDATFVVAKEGTISSVNSSNSSNKYVIYLGKPGAISDTRIWPYDATEVKVTGVPENVKVELLSYPGDNIEFSNPAYGILSHDYIYGDGKDDIITEGTLIITGTYRGDPYYNMLNIVGKFTESSNSASGEAPKIVERPISGYGLLFAELSPENSVSDTSDGIFIYVPDVQAEEELQGESCDNVSILPSEIKAELYRTKDGVDTSTKYLTSNTVWISTPSYESLPKIELTTNLNKGMLD